MKSMKQKLADGVYAASLTPLDKNLNIDHSHLLDHCRWLLENGCTGVLLMGTTGEANSFSISERIGALDTLVAGGIAAEKLLVGTGCCAIPDTLTLTHHALSCGVGGVLMLPPFYYKNVADSGIFNTFEKIIEQVNDRRLQVYFYHFPQMTQVPFSQSLIKKLLNCFPQHICGIKDSSGDWQNMRKLVENFPDFQVFSGSERFLTEITAIGGAGCISATMNLSCKLATQLLGQCDKKRIEELQNALDDLRSIIEKYPMIAVLKQVMAQVTKRENWLNMRPPQIPLSIQAVSELTTALQEIDFPNHYFN